MGNHGQVLTFKKRHTMNILFLWKLIIDYALEKDLNYRKHEVIKLKDYKFNRSIVLYHNDGSTFTFRHAQLEKVNSFSFSEEMANIQFIVVWSKNQMPMVFLAKDTKVIHNKVSGKSAYQQENSFFSKLITKR